MIDTSQARQRILERIRHAQKKPSQVSPAEKEEVAAYLSAHPRGPQQRLADDPVGQFMAQARRMSSTLEELNHAAEIPAAVARYLDSLKVSREIVINPEFQSLDWQGAGMVAHMRLIDDADLSALTGVFAAIADTGTLAFLSSPNTPASNNLLPENHVVVVYRSQLVAAMEDVFDRIRNELGELPRALNFVSGPSRTGDIEQTIVLGAHGPYRVHILLIGP
jgi:L-lactate dehydrogenase complex protein LldG